MGGNRYIRCRSYPAVCCAGGGTRAFHMQYGRALLRPIVCRFRSIQPTDGCVDKHGDRLDDFPQVRQGPVPFDPLLTAEEVALRLRVSKDWVWDHSPRKTPRLPVIRMGDGALRYRASRIEELIGERDRLSAGASCDCAWIMGNPDTTEVGGAPSETGPMCRKRTILL